MPESLKTLLGTRVRIFAPPPPPGNLDPLPAKVHEGPFGTERVAAKGDSDLRIWAAGPEFASCANMASRKLGRQVFALGKKI